MHDIDFCGQKYLIFLIVWGLKKGKELMHGIYNNHYKISIYIKTYTLEEVQDKLIETIGAENRDQFEYELKLDLNGKAIKLFKKEN